MIVETVQGEGGVNVARAEWLRGLAELCRRHDMLLIVDDVQMGCGRTGDFFSFEEAGITPDIVTLSKSIGGYGLPMALCLFRPELDVWQPGEHNGTFRGNNPAFVTATAALDTYWRDGALRERTLSRADRVERALLDLCADDGRGGLSVRGRGLVWGLEFTDGERADAVSPARLRDRSARRDLGSARRGGQAAAPADRDRRRTRRGPRHPGPLRPAHRLILTAVPPPPAPGRHRPERHTP